MGSTLQNKLKKLPNARKEKVTRRANELIAEEMTLRDLRKALDLTQIEVSNKLHINQEAVSRLEKRSDFLLSTLVSYINAMGGKLTLIAEFPNRPPVKIHGFQEIGNK